MARSKKTMAALAAGMESASAITDPMTEADIDALADMGEPTEAEVQAYEKALEDAQAEACKLEDEKKASAAEFIKRLLANQAIDKKEYETFMQQIKASDALLYTTICESAKQARIAFVCRKSIDRLNILVDMLKALHAKQYIALLRKYINVFFGAYEILSRDGSVDRYAIQTRLNPVQWNKDTQQFEFDAEAYKTPQGKAAFQELLSNINSIRHEDIFAIKFKTPDTPTEDILAPELVKLGKIAKRIARDYPKWQFEVGNAQKMLKILAAIAAVMPEIYPKDMKYVNDLAMYESYVKQIARMKA